MWATTIVRALVSKVGELREELQHVRAMTGREDYLVVKKDRGRIRYYLKNKHSGQEKYIKKADGKTLREYCRERYCLRLEKELPGQIAKLERLAERLKAVKDCQMIYDELPDTVRKYVSPLRDSQKQMIEEFHDEGRHVIHSSFEKTEAFETDKGDKVRSKSEVIIANTLYHAGIPYDYERGLELTAGIRYPDFTILNVRTGKIYYWEHMGRIDCQDYRNKMVVKLREYQEGGIFQGEKLILTMETNEKPLSVKQVRGLVEHFLK